MRLWFNASKCAKSPLHRSKALNACADLPHRPSPLTVQTLCLSVVGATRYRMLVRADNDANARAWAQELERQCRLVLSMPV